MGSVETSQVGLRTLGKKYADSRDGDGRGESRGESVKAVDTAEDGKDDDEPERNGESGM